MINIHTNSYVLLAIFVFLCLLRKKIINRPPFQKKKGKAKRPTANGQRSVMFFVRKSTVNAASIPPSIWLQHFEVFGK
jgi:hypothetical protein